MRRAFISMVAIVTTATVAACSTAPTVAPNGGSAVGHWIGSATVFAATWTFDMTLTGETDSLRGMARILAEFLERLDLRDVTLCFNDWCGGPVMIADGRMDRVGRTQR